MTNYEVTVKAATFSVPLKLCIRLAALCDIQQGLTKGSRVTIVMLLHLKPLSQSDAHSSASQGCPLSPVPLPGRRN